MILNILFLAIFSVASSAYLRGDSEAPWFCHGIDCPAFTNSTSSGGVEERNYESNLWASTDIKGVDLDSAIDTGFQRLFDYISGANEGSTKVDMTAPVLVKVLPGAGPNCESTFTVSFFVPFIYQDASNPPPAPSDSTVYISTIDAMMVGVKEFSGFAKSKEMIAEAAALEKSISESDDIKDASADGVWFFAGYDPPFRLSNRHNEIWVPIEKS